MSVFKGVGHDGALTGFADGDEVCGCRPGQVVIRLEAPGGRRSGIHPLRSYALSGGVTTLITAGFVEPPWAMERALLGMDGWPINLGLQAGARTEDEASFDALLDAGACGFKIHEDYGAYPELIDRVLRYADGHDVSVSLHTDGLHESAELEDTVAVVDDGHQVFANSLRGWNRAGAAAR